MKSRSPKNFILLFATILLIIIIMILPVTKGKAFTTNLDRKEIGVSSKSCTGVSLILRKLRKN